MGTIIRNKFVVPVAAVIFCVLFWFRPGGVEGPRPDGVNVSGKTFDHSDFTAVLQSVVSPDGHVDYSKLRQDREGLDRYLGKLRTTSPESAPQLFRTNDDKLAYYLNAYNAFVLAAVRDHCPIESVQDTYGMEGFFWRVSFLMGEKEVTLAALEEKHITPNLQGNPIGFFATVGGARGYVPLQPSAYQSEGLSDQLDALTLRVLARKDLVQKEGNVVRLSPLFDWTAKHGFISPKQWLKKFAADTLGGEVSIGEDPLPFDWGLNGACGS